MGRLFGKLDRLTITTDVVEEQPPLAFRIYLGEMALADGRRVRVGTRDSYYVADVFVPGRKKWTSYRISPSAFVLAILANEEAPLEALEVPEDESGLIRDLHLLKARHTSNLLDDIDALIRSDGSEDADDRAANVAHALGAQITANPELPLDEQEAALDNWDMCHTYAEVISLIEIAIEKERQRCLEE